MRNIFKIGGFIVLVLFGLAWFRDWVMSGVTPDDQLRREVVTRRLEHLGNTLVKKISQSVSGGVVTFGNLFDDDESRRVRLAPDYRGERGLRYYWADEITISKDGVPKGCPLVWTTLAEESYVLKVDGSVSIVKLTSLQAQVDGYLNRGILRRVRNAVTDRAGLIDFRYSTQ